MSHYNSFGRTPAQRSIYDAEDSFDEGLGEQDFQNPYTGSRGTSRGRTSPFSSADREQGSYSSPHSAHMNSILSLLKTWDLQTEDIDALAQFPEDMITVETLPKLIRQIKAKRLQQTALPLPSRAPTENWVEFKHSRSGEHPLSRPQTRLYPHDDDTWRDIRPSGSTSPLRKSTVQVTEYNYVHSEGTSTSYESLGYGERPRGTRDRLYSESNSDFHGLDIDRGPQSLAAERSFVRSRGRTPFSYELDDFEGVTPRSFPHVCSLCDSDVHSSKDWDRHIHGTQHTEGRRILFKLYPEWQPVESGEGFPSDSHSLETHTGPDWYGGPPPDKYGGPGADKYGWPDPDTYGGPGPDTCSDEPQRERLSSTWDMGEMSRRDVIRHPTHGKGGCKVVCAKFKQGSISINQLLKMAKRIGTVVNQMMFPTKAFIEMRTPEQAANMVDYFSYNPVVMNGNTVQFSVASAIETLQKSPVVCFFNLPSGKEKYPELMALARKFGTVKGSLFLTTGVFVEMDKSEDAQKMVKYYATKPFRMKGRSITIKHSTKYWTLRTVSPDRHSGVRQERHRSLEHSSRRSPSRTRERTSSPRESSRKTKRENQREERETQQKKRLSEDGSDLMDLDSNSDYMEIDEETQDSEALDQAVVVSEDSTEVLADAWKVVSETRTQAPREQPEGLKVKTEKTGNQELKPSMKSQSQAEMGKPSTVGQRQSKPPRDEVLKGESQPATEKHEPSEGEDLFDANFPENLEFITLDDLEEEEDAEVSHLDPDRESPKLSSKESSKKTQEGTVVTVTDFSRGKEYVEDILLLAKPFGKVLHHLIQHNTNEALLEMSASEDAKRMVDFYSKNKELGLVCGKPVKICLSPSCKSVQDESMGKVVYIKQLPMVFYTDAEFVKIAQQFGRVKRYFLLRNRQEGFIEMENVEDAERMAKALINKRPRFKNSVLIVNKCKKYKTLTCGVRPMEQGEKRCTREDRSSSKEMGSKGQHGKSSRKSSGQGEDLKSDKDEVKNCKSVDSSDTKVVTGGASEGLPSGERESGASSSSGVTERLCKKDRTLKRRVQPAVSLGPYQRQNPVGREFVTRKLAYFCSLCKVFYTSQAKAKNTHCSSLVHYLRLKVYLGKKHKNS
ncbi:matrin-3 isoform X2 [Amia ocellicauda]|uniref:matrin-3 isoform X2 n=1 Tax=Amia ocellicauda TaxID=2972642 RepID=UPI003463DEC3